MIKYARNCACGKHFVTTILQRIQCSSCMQSKFSSSKAEIKSQGIQGWIAQNNRNKRSRKKKKREKKLSYANNRIRNLEATIRSMRKEGSAGTRTGFYYSREWRELRYRVLQDHLKNHGRCCLVCGSKGSGIVLHVDHIKPRSKYPELELIYQNLQVLCEDCNIGKSNKDETDWRIKA